MTPKTSSRPDVPPMPINAPPPLTQAASVARRGRQTQVSAEQHDRLGPAKQRLQAIGGKLLEKQPSASQHLGNVAPSRPGGFTSRETDCVTTMIGAFTGGGATVAVGRGPPMARRPPASARPLEKTCAASEDQSSKVSVECRLAVGGLVLPYAGVEGVLDHVFEGPGVAADSINREGN